MKSAGLVKDCDSCVHCCSDKVGREYCAVWNRFIIEYDHDDLGCENYVCRE